jgi:O-antigen ligase
MLKKNSYKLNGLVLSVLLVVFISSLIIFDLEGNVIFSNLSNVLLWSFFLLSTFIRREKSSGQNQIFNTYLIFAIFSLLSVLWAYDVNLVLDYSTRIIVILINLYVLFILLSKYNLTDSILIGVIIGSFYNYLISLNFIVPNYEIYEFGRFIGSVGNPNKLSKIMTISIFSSIMLLITKERIFIFKWGLILNVFLALFVIFMTASKQAIILAPILILFSINYGKGKIKNILLIAVFIIGLYKVATDFLPNVEFLEIFKKFEYRIVSFYETIYGTSSGASTSEREYLLFRGIEIFSERPIFGAGMNNFRFFELKYAHNNYIELLVGVGLIGTIIFYRLYFVVIKKIIKMRALKIKSILYTMVLVLLLMDLITVTYTDKLLMFILLYIYVIANNHKKIA